MNHDWKIISTQILNNKRAAKQSKWEMVGSARRLCLVRGVYECQNCSHIEINNHPIDNCECDMRARLCYRPPLPQVNYNCADQIIKSVMNG
jgi:hypothetical protein